MKMMKKRKITGKLKKTENRKIRTLRKGSLFLAGMIVAASASAAGMALTGNPQTLHAEEQTGQTYVTTGGIAFMGSGTAEIVIRGNEGQSLTGKEFHIYKLFLAENSRDEESVNYTFHPVYEQALKNVTAQALAESGQQTSPEDVTEYMVIDYIQTLNTEQAEGTRTEQELEGRYSGFRYFVESLRDEIVNLNISPDTVDVRDVQSDNSIRLTGLEYGYYIVDEVSYVEGTHAASSLCMVGTANPDAEMTVKSDYPSIMKKIQEDDENPDITDPENWNDIGDFEIGQKVPYKFVSEIPDMNGYDTYYYAWHDMMDKALTLQPDSVEIVVCGTGKDYILKADEFILKQNPSGSKDTFQVIISDVKAIVDREFNQMDEKGHNVYGQKVILKYNAVLNDLAAENTGRPGFENDVRLEFSNDADSDGDGSTGFTPWDTVVCFTYQLDVEKCNEHDKTLAGAKFRLYSDENCKNEVYVKKIEKGYAVVNRDSAGGDDHTGGTRPEEAAEMVSGDDGMFTIYGLDSGIYYLKETDAPDGYRPLLDPIVLRLKAIYTSERDGYIKGGGATDQTLKNLEVMAQIKSFYNGVNQKEELNLESDIEEGSANLTVINQTGKKLPVTGTHAVAVLFAAGAGLMVFSAVKGRKKRG